MKYFNFFILAIALTIFISCNQQNEKSSKETVNPIDTVIKTSSADTSEQLMKKDDFWKIIDKSRIASGDVYQVQIESLKQILITLDTTEIVKFDNTFTSLLAFSYDYKLWGASYVINGGCSDDCFDYFREYLIAHGKVKFYATLQYPESCVSWMKSEDEDEWEGIRYSAAEAYKQKTGKDIPKIYQPKFELKGKPFDEATVNKQYPKLSKKFSND